MGSNGGQSDLVLRGESHRGAVTTASDLVLASQAWTWGRKHSQCKNNNNNYWGDVCLHVKGMVVTTGVDSLAWKYGLHRQY